MDNNTYEETRLKKDDSWCKWIKEGDLLSLISWNGKIIDVDVPKTVTLVVSETEPGVKGNTVSGGSKPATLETGAIVQVGFCHRTDLRVQTSSMHHILQSPCPCSYLP